MNSAPESVDELLEIELREVTPPAGPPARPILAVGGLCGLSVLYAAYSALSGNLGLVPILLLVVGVAGLLFVYKQISNAETGQLHDLKKRVARGGGAGSAPKPSIRVSGGRLDI